MSELTEDELAVLMIAAQGQSMIPIGRWEKSVRSLAAKGLLREHDSVNFCITPAGREILEREDNESFRGMLETSAKLKDAQTQALMSMEQAALHLSYATRAAVLATGDALEDALAKCITVAKTKALELLK